MRAALVSTQVAVALVLLVGAGLLVRSFLLLLDVNPGFDAQNVVTISTQMPAAATHAGAARGAVPGDSRQADGDSGSGQRRAR